VSRATLSIPPNAFTIKASCSGRSSEFGKKSDRARAATAEAGAAFEDFGGPSSMVLSRALRGPFIAGERICAVEVNQRNVDLLNQFAEVNRQRTKLQRQSGPMCSLRKPTRPSCSKHRVRYFPPNFGRRNRKLKRTDESASAVRG